MTEEVGTAQLSEDGWMIDVGGLWNIMDDTDFNTIFISRQRISTNNNTVKHSLN